MVLIYSGMLKIVRPYEFLTNVFQYRILGPNSAVAVSAALPFFELTLGAALAFNILPLGATALAAVIFFAFSVGQAAALVRGISADCGCFGAGEPIGASTLLRTVGLAACAFICFVSAASRFQYNAQTARETKVSEFSRLEAEHFNLKTN